MACRAANAAYVAAHRLPTGTIPVLEVRAHLEELEQLGMGTRQIARRSGVAASTISIVRAGHVRTLRPATAARLLGVSPVLASGALVAATTSWRRIDSLEREGFTRREIAWHLGARSQQLQLGRRALRASSAGKVAALYDRLAG